MYSSIQVVEQDRSGGIGSCCLEIVTVTLPGQPVRSREGQVI